MVLDLFSRKVIGWAMSNRNNSQLVQDALTMALWHRGKVRGGIVQPDQGKHLRLEGLSELLKTQGLRYSMSRKRECLDNAVAESLFGTLKTELVDHEDYRIQSEAKLGLFEYIEVFYNQPRRHSYLGYMSPAQFEAKHAP